MNVKAIHRAGRASLVDSSVEQFDLNLLIPQGNRQKPGVTDKERARNLFFLKFEKDMSRVGVGKQLDWRKMEEIVPFYRMKNAVHDHDREKASSV